MSSARQQHETGDRSLVDDRGGADGTAATTGPTVSRDALRDAVLDMEEPLADLQAALAALNLMSLANHGIENDDIAGLRYVCKQARTLADTVGRCWRVVLDGIERGDVPD